MTGLTAHVNLTPICSDFKVFMLKGLWQELDNMSIQGTSYFNGNEKKMHYPEETLYSSKVRVSGTILVLIFTSLKPSFPSLVVAAGA